jgi:phenylalanyl-tRNA synthetase alpha chain
MSTNNLSLENLLTEAERVLASCQNFPELQQSKALFLGKSSLLTQALKELGSLSPEEKISRGEVLHRLRQETQALVDKAEARIQAAKLAEEMQKERVDVSLPGSQAYSGALHPVTLVQERIEDFFHALGFWVAEGPEIEDEYHNFEALNIPADHPARDMQDTFYVDTGHLLRTHTSSVQIRTLKAHAPPLRIIAPGRVYRSDSDQTHTPSFNQIEGLVVDTQASFANLKSLLQNFLRYFFEADLDVRFRSSFFPFTEPSAEVDLRMKDPKHPLYGRWIEVLGCGMVHPFVLREVGLDPDVYQGFAFGMGMDRLAMLKYGIHDLRLFFDSDMRFLKQFRA